MFCIEKLSNKLVILCSCFLVSFINKISLNTFCQGKKIFVKLCKNKNVKKISFKKFNDSLKMIKKDYQSINVSPQ